MLLELFLGFLPALPPVPAYVCCGLLLFASGVGAGIGQDALLLALAAFTLQGTLQVVPLVVVAFFAILAGDALSLWVGRHYGARWVRRPWAARFVPPGNLPRLEDGLRRHAVLFSFLTRFLPGQRAALFFIFGTLRMPWRPFWAANAAASALYVAVLTYGARALHWDWLRLRDPIDRADDLLTAALVLVLLVAWLRARRR